MIARSGQKVIVWFPFDQIVRRNPLEALDNNKYDFNLSAFRVNDGLKECGYCISLILSRV